MTNFTTPPATYPFKIVPFLSDYGFKKVIADDTLFARMLIQILAGLKTSIRQLHMLRNEFEGISMDARSGVYDVICKDDRFNVFIVEMQKATLKFLAIRLMFYVFHFFNSMVRQGKDGFKNIPPVRGICILEHRLYSSKKIYSWEFMMRAQTGRIFSTAVSIHLVELGKFPILRKNFHQVVTDREKLLYTMKYAHLIDIDNPAEVPPFFAEPWIAEALQKLNFAAMPPEERALLDIAIVDQRILRQELDDQFEERFVEGVKIGEEKGLEKGVKIGEEKGLEKGVKIGEEKGLKKGEEKGVDKTLEILRLFKEGKSEAAIVKQTKWPRVKVRKIIQAFVALQ